MARPADVAQVHTEPPEERLLAGATLRLEHGGTDAYALEQVVRGARVYNRPVGVCGELAGNPLATILSVAMMLRYSLDEAGMAERIEAAVEKVLDDGLRTPDIMSEGMTEVNCEAMGDAVVAAL